MGRHPEILDHVVSEGHHPARCEGAHGHLLDPGDAELADRERVQRRAEGARDLRGYWNAASGEPEHEQVRPASIAAAGEQ